MSSQQNVNLEIVSSTIPVAKPKLKPEKTETELEEPQLKLRPKTHIICTVTPLNRNGKPVENRQRIAPKRTKERIKELVRAGMSIVRINFSHVGGIKPEITKQQRSNVWRLIEIVREVSKEMRIPIGIMMDLCGPRLRIGKVKESATLKNGRTFVLTTTEADLVGDEKKCYVDYEEFAKDIGKALNRRLKQCGGQPLYIFINDGKIKLKAVKADATSVTCKVIKGGKLKTNKGINVPNVEIKESTCTKKDGDDLSWIFRKERQMNEKDFVAVDYVALSFVRKSQDIVKLVGILEPKVKRDIPIIAKIETAESVEKENMIAILEQLRRITPKNARIGAVMIARGDLAVETSHERLPEIQKQIIEEAKKREIPVIVATQMLESMRENTIPLRSEAVDIANAVREGADMVMLSGETAVGEFPAQTTEMMARILRETEKAEDYRMSSEEINREFLENFVRFCEVLRSSRQRKTTTEAIAGPACEMARLLKSPAIVVSATTGITARKCSCFRPGQPIISFTTEVKTAMDLLLYRGVYPIRVTYDAQSADQLIEVIDKILEKLNIGNNEDLVVCTYGTPRGRQPNLKSFNERTYESTNTMYILRVKRDQT